MLMLIISKCKNYVVRHLLHWLLHIKIKQWLKVMRVTWYDRYSILQCIKIHNTHLIIDWCSVYSVAEFVICVNTSKNAVCSITTYVKLQKLFEIKKYIKWISYSKIVMYIKLFFFNKLKCFAVFHILLTSPLTHIACKA